MPIDKAGLGNRINMIMQAVFSNWPMLDVSEALAT